MEEDRISLTEKGIDLSKYGCFLSFCSDKDKTEKRIANCSLYTEMAEQAEMFVLPFYDVGVKSPNYDACGFSISEIALTV